MTLILLAAGLGTRYGGLKQLEPAGPNGELLMDYAIFDAHRAGFDRVIFIIRRDFEAAFRSAISDKFANVLRVDHAYQSPHDLPSPYTCPPDREKPWGTNHALLAARELITDPCVVINADDFYGLESFVNHAKFFGMVDKHPISNTEYPTEKISSRGEAASKLDIGNSVLDIGYSNSIPHFAMAGYRLSATLSPHGTVARGVCKSSPDNQLLTIREHFKIRPTPDNTAEDISDPANPIPFTGLEPVSLNNWAFTPAVVPLLQNYLSDWLSQNHANPKAECYLPSAVDHLIANRLATVSILPTSSPWFGITYKDDLPSVQQQLLALHASGHYPSKLF